MIAAAASPRTVLISSSATAVRDRFAEALLQAGHQTLTAARTSELLSSVDTARPSVDLLLLDLRLAGGDSVSLVRQIRDHAGNLPIIVFSGSIAGADEVRGLAIRTMSPLVVSTEVRARFRLPDADREFGANARVVWSDRRVGMGLQFVQVDTGDQTAVDEYVNRHGQGDTGCV